MTAAGELAKEGLKLSAENLLELFGEKLLSLIGSYR